MQVNVKKYVSSYYSFVVYFTYTINTFVCINRGDPLSNMNVQFSSKEEAIDFCEKNGKYI